MSRIILLLSAILWAFGASSPVISAELGTDGGSDQLAVSPTDWPWWRGPNRDGVASADQQPPLRWSEEENVLWKSPVPGRGHGSATVVGDHVLLATADEEKETQGKQATKKATKKKPAKRAKKAAKTKKPVEEN